MKGYFSQLAHRTGLRFTDAARSTAPTAHAQRPYPSPLHVEEVTLVPSTATVNTLSSITEPTSVTPTPEKHEVARAQTSQTIETTPTVQTEATLSSPAEFSTDVHVNSLAEDTGHGSASLADDKNFRPLSTERQSPFPERNAERDRLSTTAADNNLEPERVAPFAVPEQAHQTNAEPPAQPVSDLDPRDPVEREVLVRQYLREVRAWVAASPTLIPDAPEDRVAPETQLTTAWQPESTETFTTEHERAREPGKQTTQRDHIDIQETSLSIGSISVVIEDPKPNVTTIAPTPTAPRAPQSQPQPEPISLSRYYLQRW